MQFLRGRWPWWDRQGCFFVDPLWVVASSWTLCGWSPSWTRATVTLCGWSPPWTRATVTLHGLKSPSTWMYDSTTYRNHGSKITVSPNCVCTLQSRPFTFLQLACFTFCCSYTLCHACLICIVDVKLVPKLHLNLRNLKNCNFGT